MATWYRRAAVTISVDSADAKAKRRPTTGVSMARRILVVAALGATLLASDLASPLLMGPQAATLSAPAPVRAAIPADLGPCVAGWQEMPVPDAAFISTPFAAVTRAGRPAWILGGTNRGVLALKWTGSRWKRAAKATRGHRGLVGGETTGKNQVLAVGYYRPLKGNARGSLQPLSGRVVGTEWKDRNVPLPPGARATLTDVARLPGGKAWAVGTRLQGGRLRAYAARWNGTRWVRREPASGSGAGLLAIDRAPSGAVWAVGWREASRGRPRPLIARRTANGWQTSRGAKLAGGSAVLTDVDFRSGRDGWAVGYLTRKGTDRPEVILQHWDGRRWSLVPLPWAGDFGAIPRSISAAGPGEVWIGGTQTATNRREARGFTAHLVDGSWQISVLGVPNDVRSEVMAMAATSWGAIAAANVGATLLVLRTCSGGQTALASGGRRVAISNMKARREAEEDEDDPLNASGTGVATRSPAVAAAEGTATTLAAPVEPKGFVVRDMAAASGLAESTKTYDGFAADFDGDGRRDVFYSRHGGVLPRLAMNRPSGFKNAPGGAFSPVDRHGCAHADIDNDGSRDIICAVGASRGKAIQRHELSLAPHTDERQLVKGGLGIVDVFGRGRHVAFIRLRKGPYPDVFITNAPDRNDGMPVYNRLYRNKQGRLVPAPGMGLDTSHGAECVLTGDFDKDGDQDLAYCTQYPFKGRPAGLRLMRNEGGRLRDRTVALGIKPMNDIDVAFADVTGNGRKDLIQLSRNRLRVSRWTRSGYQRIFQARIRHAWALAAGDVDGDGRADLYVLRGNDKTNKPDRLLVSKRRGRAWQSVRIPQTSQGSADDVFTLDYDRNGLADFVVLNGRKKPGPVQLLASFRD